MSREKQISRKISRRRRRPVRHAIAKQGAAVLALGLGLAVGVPAEAAIIYTPTGGKTLSGNERFEFLTPDTIPCPQFQIKHYSYVGLSQTIYYGRIDQDYPFGTYIARSTINNNVSLLKAGDNIDSGLGWQTWGMLGKAGWDTEGPIIYGYFLGQTGYIGLQFNPGDGPHYGWAEVSMPDTATSLTIYGYAYETEPNTPIKAGEKPKPVPIPSYLLLLGTGAAGLLTFRRQKRE